jgi:hypothetical protein
MEEQYFHHIIGLGNWEDWEAGRGSYYYIEGRNGETYLPVFTTRERADSYIQSSLDTPRAHREMLERMGITYAPPMTAERYLVMMFSPEGVAKAAASVGANYLARDILTGG